MLGQYGLVNAADELAANENALCKPAGSWRTAGACLILTAMTLGLVSPGHAIDSSQTVQALYQFCKSPEEDALCLGFISGVGDAMQLIGVGVEQEPELLPFAICRKPSYGAMVQAFIKWAEQNTGEWETNRIVGVMTALRANWPCKAR
jgi:hypothetical protein